MKRLNIFLLALVALTANAVPNTEGQIVTARYTGTYEWTLNTEWHTLATIIPAAEVDCAYHHDEIDLTNTPYTVGSAGLTYNDIWQAEFIYIQDVDSLRAIPTSQVEVWSNYSIKYDPATGKKYEECDYFPEYSNRDLQTLANQFGVTIPEIMTVLNENALLYWNYLDKKVKLVAPCYNGDEALTDIQAATADNDTPQKVVINGEIIIRKNNRYYNLQGVELTTK